MPQRRWHNYGGLQLGPALFAMAGTVKPAGHLGSNVLMWMLVNGLLPVGRVTGIIIDDRTFAIPMGVIPDAHNSAGLWFLEEPPFPVFAWYWFSAYHCEEA